VTQANVLLNTSNKIKQSGIVSKPTKQRRNMTKEDLIVLCEEAINNLEEVRAALINENITP
jgi:hypothetical protein